MRRNPKSMYVYSKLRKNFGRQLLFQNVPGHVVDSIYPDKALQKQYILRNPVDREVQVGFELAEHEANTNKVETVEQGINHTEGGWPRELHLNNEDHLERYRRHVKHEDNYAKSVKNLTPILQHYVDQNNAIDMYETYFSNMAPQPPIEKYNIRVANTFRDPLERAVSCLAWTNEQKSKLAVAYKNIPYVDSDLTNEYHSCYIWDIDIQNEPIYKLKSGHPCCQIACSPVNPEIFITGLGNGLISVYDIRVGPSPVSSSSIYNSHSGPITALIYTHSRTNTEFFTGSPDGRCLWWDQRNISSPVDQLFMSMNLPIGEEPNMFNAEGVSALECDHNLPTRLLCGTESGLVINVNRLGKTHSETLTSYWHAHTSPVRAVYRSPCTVRMFITCGDWSVRIWSEEVRSAPIIVTKPYRYEVSDVSWAPLRYSSYMSICTGGIFHYWDILRKYQEPLVKLKVSPQSLTKLLPHSSGESIAVGDIAGSIFLIQLSENMILPGPNDKQLMYQTYERESKREHILDARIKEIRLKAKVKQEEAVVAPMEDIPTENQDLNLTEKEYFKKVAEELNQMEETFNNIAIA